MERGMKPAAHTPKWQTLPILALLGLLASCGNPSKPVEETVPTTVPEPISKPQSSTPYVLPKTGATLLTEFDPDEKVHVEGVHILEYQQHGPYPCLDVQGYVTSDGNTNLENIHLQVVATDSLGRPLSFPFRPNPSFDKGSVKGASNNSTHYAGGIPGNRSLYWRFTPSDSVFYEWSINLPYPHLQQPDSAGNLGHLWLTVSAHRGATEEYDPLASYSAASRQEKRSIHKSRYKVTYEPQHCDQLRMTIGKVLMDSSAIQMNRDFFEGMPDLAYKLSIGGEEVHESPLRFENSLSGDFGKYPVTFWYLGPDDYVTVHLMDRDGGLFGGESDPLTTVQVPIKPKPGVTMPMRLSAPHLKRIEVTLR
jgi:hypothetical protein